MTTAVQRIIGFDAPLPPILAELVAEPTPAPVWKQNKFALALERMMAKFKSQRVGEEVIRAHALTRWKIILDSSPESFELCRQAIEDMSISGSLQLAQVLEDALATKSTNTLLARGGPLLRFMAWCRKQASPAAGIALYLGGRLSCWRNGSAGPLHLAQDCMFADCLTALCVGASHRCCCAAWVPGGVVSGGRDEGVVALLGFGASAGILRC